MKKRILSVILTIAMILSIIPLSVSASATPVEIIPNYEWYGDGTATEFTISTVEDLAGLAKLTQGNVVVNETTLNKTDFAGKTVKLSSSLTFSENQFLYYRNSDSSTILDYQIGSFAGTFDGQGNTITGLKFYNADIAQSPKIHLFNTITADGNVKNIILDTVTANINSDDHFGFIAKDIYGNASNCHIQNVTVTVEIDSKGRSYLSSTGIMFGKAVSATITDCSVNNASISGAGNDTTDLVGALVGQANGTETEHTTISNCSVNKVEYNFARKTKRFGGFVGYTTYTDITDCTAYDVTMNIGTYCQNVGGFVGTVADDSTFTRCTVDKVVMDLDASDNSGYVGGFSSSVSGNNISFIECSVTNLDIDAELRYKNYGYLGGFSSNVGGSGTITFEKCSASGDITAEDYDSDNPAGGFFGYTGNGNLTVNECVSNVDVTTPYAAGGFIGKSSAGTFIDCEANGDVSGDTAGGFVGEIVANNSKDSTTVTTLTIDTCEANGAVTGETVASGFVGQMSTSKENDANATIVTIKNSTAATEIQSENGEIIAFAKEDIAAGSGSHYIASGNVIKFNKKVTLTANDSVVKQNVSVSVNIEGEGSFNASELVINYPNSLTFDESASTLNGATVVADNGVLKLADYGEAQSYGNGVYILVFTATKGGTSYISLTSAGFGTLESAEIDNLAQADCTDVGVNVAIKNNVTLDGIFAGDSTVANGASYTFGVEESTGAYYDYELPTATIDGVPTTVVANDDGTWTVENVTGELVITGDRSPKVHNVTVDGENAGNDGTSATYLTDYKFTLKDNVPAGLEVGYDYTVESVIIGGKEYTDYTVDGRVYTIPGADIIGDIVVKVKTTVLDPNKFSVTVVGNGAGASTLSTNVVDKNGDVTLTVPTADGYVYTVTAGDYEVEKNGDVYTVKNVTTAVEFNVSRVVDVAGDTGVTKAEVSQYVTLDGTVMWLVTIGDKLDGKVYTYDGQKMFWSEKYTTYATLVVAETTPAIEAENFDILTANASSVSYEQDVNMTGKVDANDAQLVWNMYEAKYSTFTSTVTLEKFLRADVNGDKVIDVKDATAIVNNILGK